jgi:hypothetical protein
VDALQVGKADVLVDPQALDLVEHRRMRGIRVHAVGAPGAMTLIGGWWVRA